MKNKASKNQITIKDVRKAIAAGASRTTVNELITLGLSQALANIPGYEIIQTK